MNEFISFLEKQGFRKVDLSVNIEEKTYKKDKSRITVQIDNNWIHFFFDNSDRLLHIQED